MKTVFKHNIQLFVLSLLDGELMLLMLMFKDGNW